MGLDARDRRWLRELIYGMLRRRAWLDALLSDRVRGGLARLDADVTDLLRLGAFQLLAMDSVPAYAAIAQTVELTKQRHGIGASRLANAVLRRLDRDRAEGLAVPTPTDPLNALALEYSHPRSLVARWVARWGAEETRGLLAANNNQAPVIVRPFGIVREQLEAMLESAGVQVEDAPLVRDSLELRSIPSLHGAGCFSTGILLRPGSCCHARRTVREPRTGQHGRRPVCGAGREGARAVGGGRGGRCRGSFDRPRRPAVG